MIDLLAFGIILDDIETPDRSVHRGLLGGGGPQTAVGMRLPFIAGFSDAHYSVGIVSGVGPDFPERDRAWLAALGVDMQGLVTAPLPTARALQSLQPDGSRSQVFLVGNSVIREHLARSIDRLPLSYRNPLGIHVGIHPDDPDLSFLRDLARFKGETRENRIPPGITYLQIPVVSVEPFRPAGHRPSDAALRALCSACDIFSPNTAEARSLVGDADPAELARRLLDAGASIVALRMGAEGSLLSAARPDLARLIHVPAVQSRVVDPTGAGNAYCGALLAGLLATGDLRTGAEYGAVAASFLVAQVGLPDLNDRLADEALRRLEALRR
ncbi:MAG: PfkB family carbohydrate kinase [Rudaea sp.]